MKTLRESDRVGLRKLLEDADPATLKLLEEQFHLLGEEGVRFLEELLVDLPPSSMRWVVETMLRLTRERGVAETFARYCAADEVELEKGCWLLAQTRYPELDEVLYRRRLDQMAQELKERLTGRETPRSTVEVCNHYLFRLLGFRGNQQDYYDPDNSYLNRVLDRRLGIPITLAAVYLLLAARLRLPLHGVNLPGHFILKWQSELGEFFVDPFNNGRLLTVEDCRRYCERQGYAFQPAQLGAASARQIVLRMCRNLQAVYGANDEQRAAQYGRYVDLLARV